MKRLITFSLPLIFTATAVHALVLADDPTGNTSAPTGINGQPSDPGFANIGSVKGSSGVYLGNGWVLTARHVGAGSFTTGTGTTYQYQDGTAHNITGTDLTLFKLTATPSELIALTLSSGSPELGSEIVMIGSGRTASSSAPTHYYVDTTGKNPDDTPKWTWSTSDFEGSNDAYNGFLTNSNKSVRWGTNTIDGYGFDDGGIGYFYATSFDMAGGTAYEAQAVSNDSGGAAFFFDGEYWYLSGIMVSVGIFPDQPSGPGSAFDGNLTYIVDLSQYAAQINSVIPEPTTYALISGLMASGLILRRSRRRQ